MAFLLGMKRNLCLSPSEKKPDNLLPIGISLVSSFPHWVWHWLISVILISIDYYYFHLGHSRRSTRFWTWSIRSRVRINWTTTWSRCWTGSVESSRPSLQLCRPPSVMSTLLRARCFINRRRCCQYLYQQELQQHQEWRRQQQLPLRWPALLY